MIKTNKNLSIMKTENVKQIIQELFSQNFNLYTQNYHLNEDGTATNEASETVADVAKGYFENRNESEVERDEKLRITEIDYVDWCMLEFSNLIPEAK